MTGLEPFLKELGKYSWRSLVGAFVLSCALLVFGSRLGMATWLVTWRPWLIVTAILTGAILVTYPAQSLARHLSSSHKKTKLHFVDDSLNTGWSKQSHNQIHVLLKGTLTCSGEESLQLMKVRIKGRSFASFALMEVWVAGAFDSNWYQRGSLSLYPSEPSQIRLTLKFDEPLGEKGKPLSLELVFMDNLRREYSMDKLVLAYLGKT